MSAREGRYTLAAFMSAEAVRRGKKDPLQWILEQVSESNMEDGWKETMSAKNLELIEEERKPKSKPKPKPLAKAWEDYKEAQSEAQIVKRRLSEEAQSKVESEAEVQRRQQ